MRKKIRERVTVRATVWARDERRENKRNTRGSWTHGSWPWGSKTVVYVDDEQLLSGDAQKLLKFL